MVPVPKKIHFYHKQLFVCNVTSYTITAPTDKNALPQCKVWTDKCEVVPSVEGSVVNVVAEKNALIFEVE